MWGVSKRSGSTAVLEAGSSRGSLAGVAMSASKRSASIGPPGGSGRGVLIPQSVSAGVSSAATPKREWHSGVSTPNLVA